MARAGCWRASVVSTRPGPHSINTAGPAVSTRATPSENFTGNRSWRTQYSGSTASLAVSSDPVRLEMMGIFGAESLMVRRNARQSSRMGSSIAECAAMRIRIRV